MAKGKSSKKSLKAALSSQQSRLKKKQEAVHAAQITERATKSLQTKSKGKAVVRPPTIPFKPTDRILLIGEGNFSFARALVLHPPALLEYLAPASITATAYDSEEDCYAKYPDAQAIITTLREKGVTILFGVDATKLEKCSPLKGQKWDKIVWNFPHAGKGISDQDRNILSNQLLILGFLRSAAGFLVAGPKPVVMLSRKRKTTSDDDENVLEGVSEDEESSIESDVKPRGTILITLRNVTPYTLWSLTKLAKSPPPPSFPSAPQNPHYTQLRSFKFHRSFWTGYSHCMTKGERAHGQGTTGEGGEDRTWEFCLEDSQ